MGVTEPVRLDKRFAREPWSVYPALRADVPARPVIMPDGVPGWLVTRYAEARMLLDDPRVSKDLARGVELFPSGTAGPYGQPLAGHMLNADPPDHTRLRGLVSKAFTPRAVARLRPRIEEITDGLLDTVAGEDVIDLMDAFAFPLPIAVISELLGVPHADRERLRAWVRAIVSGAPADVQQVASDEVLVYFRSLVADKRAVATEDMLSDLVRVTDGGDRLTEDELVAMAFLLLLAGHETTVNLIGNSVLALIRNPDQLKALRDDPALLPAAVEEFLRFEGPLHIATLRFTVADVPVGDAVIPAGSFVMVSLLAANRDPERFASPDELDIGRSATGHVAFGHGIHYCLGAPLARLEMEIAIGRLLDRFDVALVGDVESLRWRGSTLVHGLRNLPVRLLPIRSSDEVAGRPADLGQ
ncbi:MAG TPA: cytochrome P450 [Pseudonocardiaceae bacterium]|jgi:cytochrome P450|nr:cytochrome P450 [Pseudonocardiaceae bacterium]